MRRSLRDGLLVARILILFWLAALVPIGAWGLWTVGMLRRSDIDPATSDLPLAFLVALGTTFGMSSILAMFLSLRIIRPIQAMTGVVRSLAVGDLSKPLGLTAQGELGELLSDLDQLRVRLREAKEETLRTQQHMESLVKERTVRLDRRAEQLRTINSVGRRMVEIRNIDELLPFAVNELCRAFHFGNVNLFLVGESPGILVARAGAGDYGRIPLGSTYRIGEQGIVGWVAGTGQPMLVNDVRLEPRYVLVEALRETAAELAVPIRLGDQVLGVLDIESREQDAFEEADVNTAQTLADLIAVAIENARLYDQTRELAVTEERNRLAREIHDTIAQGLAALAMQLELADASISTDTARAAHAIQRALGLARLNLDEARRSVQNLRSGSLQQRSLATAVRSLLEQAGRESGFYFSFQHHVEHELPQSIEAGVYRIIQEAINNIAKHAQASEVTVSIRSNSASLGLVIEDDGIGFDPNLPPESRPGHFGLLGMQERTHLLGGELVIRSSPAEGTRLEVKVPLERRSTSGARRKT